MTESSPAAKSRVISVTPAPAPAERKHLMKIGEDGKPMQPSPRPVRSKKPTKPNKLSKDEKSAAREEKRSERRDKLAARLPDGVYENRPKQKRFVLHWLYFWAWARLRLYKAQFVPNPPVATRELITRHRRGLMQDAEETQLKTVTVNQKGGTGKTPVATAVAAAIAWVTQQFTLLVDANQTKGNTASRIGVKITMSIRQAVSLFEEQFKKAPITHEWAVQVFKRHPAPGYGSLRVITSDNHNQRKTRLGYARTLEFFRGVKPAVGHMVFDCGNTTDGAATRAAIEFADVPMFVARLSLENSLTDLLDTINHYRDTAPGKVEHAMIVIIDHRHYRLNRRRNTNEQDYARFFNKDCEAEALQFTAEQVVLIRHDAFYPVKQLNTVEDPDDLIKVIMLEKLNPKTVEAYLRLVRQLFALQREVDAKRSTEEEVVCHSELDFDEMADLLDPMDQPEVAELHVSDSSRAVKDMIMQASSLEPAESPVGSAP